MLSSTPTPLGEDLFLVRGRQHVLALAPVLQELAARTHQFGAMHWLEYFLDAPSLASKPPYLVLQLRKTARIHRLQADHIIAAALFFEYRFAGLRTRVFSTDDAVGFRTVIAAPDQRAHFAERTANALLQREAHVVLTTYESTYDNESALKPASGTLLGYRERRVGRMLTLAPTYDETLASLGRLTRRNLRYYRRHLSSRVQLDFVADGRAELTFDEFKALNDKSLNPVRSKRELWFRWRSSCSAPGGFVAGLRSAEGKWLSLIGGWRHDTTTVIHWQLNASGHEHYSIGVVMRSFFLEHEIACGARKLLMFGGTPHAIRHAFDEDRVVDLVLGRPSVRFSILKFLAGPLIQRSKFAARNHLMQTLAELPLLSRVVRSPLPVASLEAVPVHPDNLAA